MSSEFFCDRRSQTSKTTIKRKSFVIESYTVLFYIQFCDDTHKENRIGYPPYSMGRRIKF